MSGAKDLTQGPILRQLYNLAIPIMGTSFVQMAYNLTDMAWVGRLGSESVAAVGSVGILTWMASSIALLNKVGSEVSVGHSVGMQDAKMARNFASHNITISFILSIILGIIFFSFSRSIISLYGLSDSITFNAVNYLKIISTALPFVFMSAAFSGIFNACGRTIVPFYINGVGLIMNMVLDPLFIFVFHMGTNGAAIATWIAQFTVFILFVYKLKFKKALFNGIPFIVSLKKEYTKKILKLGVPVALLNTLFAFVNIILGKSASAQGGHLGLMTLTTGGQIEAVSWNTSQGFSSALSSFVAQNYAAGKKNRITKAFKITIGLASFFGLLSSFAFIFYGNEIFSIFVPEAEAYTTGGRYLTIDGYSQIFMMIEITTQGMFYGVGRSLPPAIISIGCNYFRIPLSIFLISLGMGLDGIWWSISITSIMKGIICIIWLYLIRKKLYIRDQFA
ncbi:MATE family efflux transporter [Phocaeicola paurosaccharolyticus]|uniref:MATE family efflux transporter n=1 Tax=Phocaeicola paurosaccharolyticus TaxID=732242 RepID=UPI0004684B29|nr:MATE family efflux transporter [Phocaeicola paurosaccharolyticus]